MTATFVLYEQPKPERWYPVVVWRPADGPPVESMHLDARAPGQWRLLTPDDLVRLLTWLPAATRDTVISAAQAAAPVEGGSKP